jgi:hypothetical protein
MPAEKKKQKYLRPEVKVVDLSFTRSLLGICHTHTVTFPATLPVITCVMSGCQTHP